MILRAVSDLLAKLGLRAQDGAPLSADEQAFRDYVLPSLDMALFRRVLRTGAWREAEAGSVLTRRGETVTHMLFLVSGEVEITVDDVDVGTCRRGDLIGEIGILTETPATATAVAKSPVRFLALERMALLRLIERERSVEQAIDRSYRKALRDKLASTNEALADAETRAAAALRRNRPPSPRGG